MDNGESKNREGGTAPEVTLATLFLSFLRLGLTAFGGPAMVAYIGELAVKRKKWIDQEAFKSGTVLAQSIPGATAMQVAAYVGLQARGFTGALASYTGFATPAFVLMLILSSLYAVSRSLPWAMALFAGLQVIVVAIVANATYTFARSSLKGLTEAGIAVVAAGAFWVHMSAFYVICGAAIAGILVSRPRTQPESSQVERTHPTWGFFIGAVAFLVLGLAYLYLANAPLFRLACLMLKVDLFAFGGGFASVPLMLQEVVHARGWLDSTTFMDGIALGQMTPGPIVITATFVGYLVYGLSGALVATIAIFTPSFLLLVGCAPFIGRLKGSPIFARATQGILASFVGLLLCVTMRFAIAIPWDILRGCLIAAALIALLRKVDLLYVVLVGAALSIALLR
jgi:chromate transporter